MPRGKAPAIEPGDTFGLLTVVGFHSQTSAGKRKFLCRCACGGEKIAVTGDLRAGRTTSCGCVRKETTRQRGYANRTHGHRSGDHQYQGTRAYYTWANMIARCTNANHKSFGDYGGRGITVCPEWRESFETFLSDMGDPPDGRSLDRIDNGRGYSKDNCRWATPIEQANNRRSPKRAFDDLLSALDARGLRLALVAVEPGRDLGAAPGVAKALFVDEDMRCGGLDPALRALADLL